MNLSQHSTFKGVLLAATVVASPLIVAAANPAAAQVAVVISVQIAPPILPVYTQPPLPAYGYIWTPGYWSWARPVGYYWVPGTWVLPPDAGLLWTPPYWGWSNGAYVFHDGYWGPHVGFYGGVNYGYGYGGHGYEGGRWDGGRFAYNRAVNNFGSVHVADAYTTKVTALHESRVSYAGGTGGLATQPTPEERNAGQDHHVPPTRMQAAHTVAAVRTPALMATHNAGRPPIAATSHPGQFTGAGVVRAQPAGGNAPATGHGGPPRPAEAGPAHPAQQHATEPRAPAAQAHQQPPQRAAPPPAERASQHPAGPGSAHPVEQRAAAPHLSAPQPAPAREPAAAKGPARPDEARKPNG